MVDNKQATLDLGRKPVAGLLMQYALPAVAAMIASSLYNIIDRAFIGQVVGPEAIAGLAITMPFMNLSAAFGAGVGVGAATAISVKLGQKDYQSAENLLGNTVTLNIIIGVCFMVFGLIFVDPILRFFGASDATLPYARSFMQVILLGNVFTHMYFGMNNVLRAASKPRLAMFITMFTVGMNILLDVLFIPVLGFGIRGAAAATVISQTLAMIWQLVVFSNQKELLHLKRGIYKPKSRLMSMIIGVGISPFLMNVCTSVIVIFENNQFLRYGGDMAVGAFGIANSASIIFVMIVMGINQGMQPIAGYNYGARLYDRMLGVVKVAIIAATVVTTTGWVIGMFFAPLVARIFTTDAELIRIASKGIRTMMFAFPIIGYQMVVANFFQCIGKVKVSIFLALSRQLLFLLPLLILLPMKFDLAGVWASMPGSDFVASIITLAIMVIYMRKFNRERDNMAAQSE